MTVTIPKKIHYCWFGNNPLPPLALKCIDSWKRYLPDYEIKEWNENNFDINIIPFTEEAYQAGKYAFVSDFARFWILYHYGGIYLDTDVEIIKPIHTIVEKGAFMGRERDGKLGTDIELGIACNPGLGMGCAPNMEIYKEILAQYTTSHFIDKYGKLNLKTVVSYTTESLVRHGLQPTNQIQKIAGIYIYPKEYFCPMEVETGKITISKNTFTIHHYTGSWTSRYSQFKFKTLQFIMNNKLLKFLYTKGYKKILKHLS